jgi:hypothetical protein
MNVFELFMAAVVTVQAPLIVSKHSRVADNVSETLSVDCAGKRLELIRHRPHAQTLSMPELRINNNPIRVPPGLRDDLLTPRADYKFGAACLPNEQGFQVDIWEASRRRGEPTPRYRWGRLILDNNDHFDWTGLQPIDADKFWFS